ncbi:hypothetical protein TOTORO_00450 [Serratia phage vB_SmaS-Totoro]|nr:hypothetical protein TOTORO_00450 [Serratia phage vB_SmaS-Totoro]
MKTIEEFGKITDGLKEVQSYLKNIPYLPNDEEANVIKRRVNEVLEIVHGDLLRPISDKSETTDQLYLIFHHLTELKDLLTDAARLSLAGLPTFNTWLTIASLLGTILMNLYQLKAQVTE